MVDTEPHAITADQFRRAANLMEHQLGRVIVGQENLVHDVMVTLLAGGNALLEGVPGLGKTLLVRTLAEILDGSFNRIQFTPDLMPADIIGTMIISEDASGQRGFRFEAGPIFANLVLADEINRAAPRTQSALLEAMQEGHVTVAGESYPLPRPFFVLATQNPIEMEGTYPLPEAQIDRFLYKLHVPYPDEEQLIEIARRTTGVEIPHGNVVAKDSALVAMQHLARQVPVADGVYRYAARLVGATHPDHGAIAVIARNLRVGASPRGLQAMISAAKVEALLDGRKAVAIEDVRNVIYPALRHRLILNFEAQAEGVSPDSILDEIVRSIAVPN